jgi:hypothetical protein
VYDSAKHITITEELFKFIEQLTIREKELREMRWGYGYFASKSNLDTIYRNLSS